MPRAFVLMTALPPTFGHLRLIQFAQSLAPTTVLVCSQPDEPYVNERFKAVAKAAQGNVFHLHRQLEQNPEAPGFWEMWRSILRDEYGLRDGDYIVASELYGYRLAEAVGAQFMPYDLHRTITPGRATYVREQPVKFFGNMLPEFRKNFVSRVTLFGAESCGKTTLTQELAGIYDAPWVFEWARPYLETAGPDLTEQKMHDIWHGQAALQQTAKKLDESPVVFQDTDLYSTVGYWDLNNLGVMTTPSPDGLLRDAHVLKSDLYLVCPANIPMEQDPLRYAGDVREASDEYWLSVLNKYGLHYKVLTASTITGRVAEASRYVDELLAKRLDFSYERSYN